jgi:hypothetical protein
LKMIVQLRYLVRRLRASVLMMSKVTAIALLKYLGAGCCDDSVWKSRIKCLRSREAEANMEAVLEEEINAARQYCVCKCLAGPSEINKTKHTVIR